MRVELIGDRMTMVNPSFWKAMWYKTLVELLVSTMTLFTYALAMRTEITSALSSSGYSASLASKVTYGAWGRFSRPLDVSPDIPFAYELFDLILKVVTFLCVVVIASVESTMPCLILEILGTLHGVGSS
ncbi:hypothetical protein B296_00004033 [Ensete ventricosum]|uniref:Uncharacterized protein n=1 Tax=Ensete ventricosum TaxID=4639 RepID=A0A427B6T1_ENSVE|nr:hypothetical protein B296_00004033 [Ensete ventricosum]